MYWITVHFTFSVLYTLFCLRNRLPYVSKLWLPFTMENNVRVLVWVQFITPSGTSLLQAKFSIWLQGVIFCGVLFCGYFFLRELIFADRGQSAKSAKIRTRKIFMLHGMPLQVMSPWVDTLWGLHGCNYPCDITRYIHATSFQWSHAMLHHVWHYICMWCLNMVK